MNLKKCPFSDKHQVFGGHPEYICVDCGTEWSLVNYRGQKYILYIHFNSSGDTVKKWREKIKKGVVA
jgi:hypothetical protein